LGLVKGRVSICVICCCTNQVSMKLYNGTVFRSYVCNMYIWPQYNGCECNCLQ